MSGATSGQSCARPAGELAGDGVPHADALYLFLAMVAGSEPDGGLLEIRWRRPQGGMGQCWHDCHRPKAILELITSLGLQTDVYVSVVPRRRHEGGAAAVERGWVCWADCDGAAAVERLESFEPAASVVVRSGTGENAHAYWPLREPVGREELRDANRRLAEALGADRKCADPARILRPPGTFNHKHDPPTPVVCEKLEIAGAALTVDELLAGLPAPASGDKHQRVAGGDDVLLSIPPRVYVAILTGRDIDSSGKIACPFHDDRTPSLHAYTEVDQGWHCFGCERGGTIIDFGACLYGIEPRGSGYHEIRRRLATDLLQGAA